MQPQLMINKICMSLNQVCTSKGKCKCKENLDPETACQTGKTGTTCRFSICDLKDKTMFSLIANCKNRYLYFKRQK